MIYKIKQVESIVKGFTYTTYHVEADSYEEALNAIIDGDVDPLDWNAEVHESEHMYYEKI